jgi:hypothetical protein
LNAAAQTAGGLAQMVGLPGAGDRFAQDAAQATPDYIKGTGWFHDQNGNLSPSTFINHALFTAGQAVPQLGAIIAGGAVAGPGGAIAAAYPQAAGPIQETINQQPGGGTTAQRLTGFGLAAPLAAVQTLAPESLLASATGKEATFSFGHGILGATASNAAAGALGSGAQTAAEMAFRPDLTAVDKAKNVVSSIVEGGAVGGAFGGLLGTFSKLTGRVDPNASNQTVTDATDNIMKAAGMPGAEPKPPALEGPEPATGTDLVPTQNVAAPFAPKLPDWLNQLNPIGQAEAASLRVPRGPEPLGEPMAPIPPVEPTPAPDLGAGPRPFDTPEGGQVIPYEQPPVPQLQQAMERIGLPTTSLTGPESDFIARDRPASVPHVYNELVDELANQTPFSKTPTFQGLAQALGIVDADGKPRDIAQELDTALQNSAPKPVIEQLEKLKALQEAATQLRPKLPAPTPQLTDANVRSDTTEIPQVKPKSIGDILQNFTAQPAPTGFTLSKAEVAKPPVSYRDTGAEQGPQTLADRVMSVARDIAGPDGGRVPIDQLREEMKNQGVAPKDTDQALREIHVDDTENQLVPAEAGDRRGRGAIQLGDYGRVHFLDVEPSNAVQEQSPTGVPVPEQTVSGSGVRGGDTAGSEIAPPRPETPEGAFATQPAAPVPDQAQITALTTGDAQLPPLSDLSSLPPAQRIVDPAGPQLEGGNEPLLRMQSPRQMARAPDAVISTHFDSLMNGLRPDIQARIHLVRPEEMSPEVLQAHAANGWNPAETKAIYDKNGDVTINRAAVGSRADLEDSVAHEVFGHLGTRERLGPNPEAALANVFDRMGGMDHFIKLAKKTNTWGESSTGGAGMRGYLPAEGVNLTTGEKAHLVDELLAHAAEPSRASGPITSFLRGWVADFKKAIAGVFRKVGMANFAKKFEGFGVSEVAQWVRDNRQALRSQQPVTAPRTLGGSMEGFARRIGNQLSAAEEAAAYAGTAAQKIERFAAKTRLEMPVKVGRATDILTSLQGMQRAHPELPIERFNAIQDAHTQLAKNVNRVAVSAHDPLAEGLASLRDQDLAGRWQSAMVNSRIYGYDPTRPISEQPHVTEPAAISRHAQDYATWNTLGQPLALKRGLTNLTGNRLLPAGALQDAFRNQVLVSHGHDLANIAGLLSKAGQASGLAGPAPVDLLRAYNSAGIAGDPLAHHTFWGNAAAERIAEVDRFLADQRQQAILGVKPQATPEKTRAAQAKALEGVSQKHAALIEARDIARDKMDAMERAPQLELGRLGDHYVSAFLRTTDGRTPTPEAVAALDAKLTNSGFRDVGVESRGDNHAFMRVEGLDQAQRLRDLVEELREEGHLEPGMTTRNGQVGDKDARTTLAPKLTDLLMRDLEEGGRFDAGDRDLRDKTREQVAAMVGDLTAHKMLFYPKPNTLGFSKNLMQGLATADAAKMRSVAQLLAHDEQAAALKDIVDTANAYSTSKNVALADRLHDVTQEILRRTPALNPRQSNSFVQAMTKMAHPWFIGASPAYYLMQASQWATLSAPELMKRNSAVASYKALTQATTPAIKFMWAMRGKGATDYTIKPELLDGVGPELKKFLMHLVDTGTITNGFSQMLSERGTERVSSWSKLQHMASATAGWAEAFPRAQLAIAAYKLYKGTPEQKTDYAIRTVNEALQNWGSWNKSRAFGTNGLIGSYSPLVFQFHDFQGRMFEKLWHEGTKAMQGTWHYATGQQVHVTEKEAQRWMLAHMAAAGAFGGMMGLPAAGFIFGAASSLSRYWNDGEAYDFEAHFRNFLADTFGKEMGEVIARGLPRAAGIDLGRYSDQEMLPYITPFLEDRRRFQDAAPAALMHSAGASVSMMGNTIMALGHLANGKPLDATMAMAPTILRDVVGSYRLTDQGYVDYQNRPLPLKPSTLDIMATALGLHPSDKIESDEKGKIVAGALEDMQHHAENIRQQLALARDRGDIQGATTWLQKAVEFDQDPTHMANRVLPTLGTWLARRQNQTAIAGATGQPLGVTPIQGIALQGLINH